MTLSLGSIRLTTGRCLIITCLLLSSCSPTVLPDGILPNCTRYDGEWQLLNEAGKDVSQQEIPHWRIANGRIETYDTEGTRSILEGNFFTVNNTVYLDVSSYGLNIDVLSELLMAHIAPIHSLFKISEQQDTLTFTPINLAWLEQKLQEGNLALAHIRIENDEHLIINAAIEDWIFLIRKQRMTPELFLKDHDVILKRLKPGL